MWNDILAGKANKFVTAITAAVVGFATAVVYSAPAAPTSKEYLGGGIGLAIALGIYQVGNK